MSEQTWHKAAPPPSYITNLPAICNILRLDRVYRPELHAERTGNNDYQVA